MLTSESTISSVFKNLDIDQLIKSIPDNILNMIMKRAFEDSRLLCKESSQDDMKQLTYVIYRAYVIGMVLEKARENSENNRIDSIKYEFQPIKKVVFFVIFFLCSYIIKIQLRN